MFKKYTIFLLIFLFLISNPQSPIQNAQLGILSPIGYLSVSSLVHFILNCAQIWAIRCFHFTIHEYCHAIFWRCSPPNPPEIFSPQHQSEAKDSRNIPRGGSSNKFTLNTLHFILYSSHPILCTVNCTLYTLHYEKYKSILYSVQRPPYITLCTLYTDHCPVSTVQWPLSTVHCPLSTVPCPLSTVHCSLYQVLQYCTQGRDCRWAGLMARDPTLWTGKVYCLLLFCLLSCLPSTFPVDR